MKRSIYKSIILLLVYALALNPLTTVLADQAGGLLSNAVTKHCEMESTADKNSMNMDETSTSMSHNMDAGCKCSKDCNQGDCGQQCADCGHFFGGIPVDILVLTQSKSNRLKLSSDFRHQLPTLMHYRPPIILHS